MVEVKGEIHQGKHEAIVTRSKWKRVRTLMTRRTPQGEGTRTAAEGRHCSSVASSTASAAQPMRTRPTRAGSRGAYICAGAYENGSDCAFGPIPQEAVDGPFLAAFTERYVDLDATRQAAVERVERDRTLAREARVAAERQLAASRRAASAEDADYLAGDLSAKRYEPMADKLERSSRPRRLSAGGCTAREAESGTG